MVQKKTIEEELADVVAEKEAVGEGKDIVVVVDKATVVEIEILEGISAMRDGVTVDAVITIASMV